MSEIPPNGLRWRVDDHERRLNKLEEHNFDVLAERVRNLENRVRGMTVALWSTAGALLLAALSYALANQ